MIFATKVSALTYLLFDNCMNGIYLIIGGNLGKRAQYLAQSRSDIDVQIGTILKQSSIYETSSWGNTTQHPFLNQVLYLETTLDAESILQTCLAIEKKIGRIRGAKWDARIIDIDILFFNNEIIAKEQLKIPHPFLHLRRFVLTPLHEIAPHLVHPILQQSITQLLQNCEDGLAVRKITESSFYDN